MIPELTCLAWQEFAHVHGGIHRST
jgi:hypothetical protein